MNVVRPLIVDMLSDENRLAAPLPPPALRIVVARFSVVDFDRERIKSNKAGVDDRPLFRP
jgi:hypothetical protein